MSIDTIVDVQIDVQDASISRAGFGIPLLMSAEASADNRFPTTAKIYTALTELGSTGDNYDPLGVTFLKAQAIFGQNPKVAQLIIGKRANLPLMTINIIPVAVDDTLYRITINGEAFDFTSDATATLPEIIAGLVPVINAGAQDVLATDIGAGTSLRIEAAASPGGAATAGKPFTIVVNDRLILPQQNDTPDPGIVADIDAVLNNIDGSTAWYALELDSYGAAEITSAATKTETLVKKFAAITSDDDVIKAGAGDIGSSLQALNLTRTHLSWHENPHIGKEAAWDGKVLPTDPGAATWKFKTLALIPASLLTPSEKAQLETKNVNRFIDVGGKDTTCDGKMAGGRFIDITRDIDQLTARLKENVFALLSSLPKVPFTDPGIALVENEVRGTLDTAVADGILAADPAPIVTVPKAADVDAADKIDRKLPDVTFVATLAGAIHSVVIRGTITP